jgi:hypothetical protein
VLEQAVVLLGGLDAGLGDEAEGLEPSRFSAPCCTEPAFQNWLVVFLAWRPILIAPAA